MEKVDLHRIQVQEPDLTAYEIDFDKVSTLDDVIRILKAFNIKFYGNAIDPIKDLVKKSGR